MIFKNRTVLPLALLAVFAASAAFAGNKNIGTTGGQFLKIGAGARPAAMGDTFVAVADDVNAVAWNPAGLGRLTSAEFTTMRAQWFQDIDYNFMAGAYPFAWGTLGLGFTTLSVDGMDKYLTDSAEPDGSFNSQDAAYTLSYGKAWGDNLSVGFGVGMIRQQIDHQSASGLTGSAGVLWHTPHHPLTLGMAGRNLGGKLKFSSESDPLPMTITFGMGYKLFSDRLTLGLDMGQTRSSKSPYSFGGGAEFTQRLPWDMAASLRGGYNAGSTSVEDGSGLSMGMGLVWRSWGFDMAWAPYGVLGNTSRYAVIVKF